MAAEFSTFVACYRGRELPYTLIQLVLSYSPPCYNIVDLNGPDFLTL